MLPAGGGHEHRAANRRVTMTCARSDDPTLVETADESDRAHDVRDGAGRLVPARLLPRAMSRPRRYPRAYMTSRGVSVETALEALGAAERRCREELGGPCAPRPIRCSDLPALARGAARLRDIIEPHRRALAALERAEDAPADRWLASSHNKRPPWRR